MPKILNRISFDEALERIKSRFNIKRNPINLNVNEAIDKILASDIICESDVPPLPVSMVDGFAFNNIHDELVVTAKVGPGSAFTGKIEDGQYIEVLTGAYLPPDIKFVVPKEHVIKNGNKIRLTVVPENENNNIMPAGFDCKSNEIIAKKGEKFEAGLAFFLNYIKVNTVSVKPQAKAGIFSIGNELTNNIADKQKVHNSNPIFLSYILKKMGLVAHDLGILKDDEKEIFDQIKSQIDNFDLLITSGGSSVGEKDLVNEALTLNGAEQIFHGLKLKPGRTGGLYVLNGKPIIVTSGNIQASIIETMLIGSAVAQEMGYSVNMNTIRAVIDRDVYFDTPSDFYNAVWLRVYELKNEIIASPVISYSTSRSVPFKANAFSIIKSSHIKKNTVIEANMIGDL
jgi:molybdopterin molybdotransferase